MKAYLASSYSRRHEMQGRRTQLHDEGIVVTSRWLDDEDPWDPADHARGYRLAAKDLEDIREADVVVCFTGEPVTTTGGRHVEFGYALGIGKPIVVVGPAENVFYCLRNERIARFEYWDDDAEGALEQLIILRDWYERFDHIFQGSKVL